ncbi:hypothetical protein DIPPA_25709 [Diplonema papillatum]|nr:hypothetical protein DIPPA_09246 [Diplonema papillatum]KAJ9448258.1 hypothetical protein DIPPA_25709 [Diplonema papillatum]|eukprot:gene3436-5379_t
MWGPPPVFHDDDEDEGVRGNAAEDKEGNGAGASRARPGKRKKKKKQTDNPTEDRSHDDWGAAEAGLTRRSPSRFGSFSQADEGRPDAPVQEPKALRGEKRLRSKDTPPPAQRPSSARKSSYSRTDGGDGDDDAEIMAVMARQTPQSGRSTSSADRTRSESSMLGRLSSVRSSAAEAATLPVRTTLLVNELPTVTEQAFYPSKITVIPSPCDESLLITRLCERFSIDSQGIVINGACFRCDDRFISCNDATLPYFLQITPTPKLFFMVST